MRLKSSRTLPTNAGKSKLIHQSVNEATKISKLITENGANKNTATDSLMPNSPNTIVGIMVEIKYMQEINT